MLCSLAAVNGDDTMRNLASTPFDVTFLFFAAGTFQYHTNSGVGLKSSSSSSVSFPINSAKYLVLVHLNFRRTYLALGPGMYFEVYIVISWRKQRRQYHKIAAPGDRRRE